MCTRIGLLRSRPHQLHIAVSVYRRQIGAHNICKNWISGDVNTRSSMALVDQVCLVTGASRGIGKGIALQLGENGATVYITGASKVKVLRKVWWRKNILQVGRWKRVTVRWAHCEKLRKRSVNVYQFNY